MTIHRTVSPSTHLSYLTNIPTPSRNAPIKRLSLMIHGWGCQATHYIPLITHLACHGLTPESGDLFIALDLPGHGQSPKSALPEPEKGGIAKLILQLCAEVLDSFGLQHNQTETVIYAHSMGIFMALEVYSSLGNVISHAILSDGAHSRDSAPEGFDLERIREQAVQYREVIQDRLNLYFGPRTSKAFEEQTREGFARLDFEYALRMSYWYGGFDAGLAKVLDGLEKRNREAVGAGLNPTKVLLIQSQEAQGSNGRHGIQKGDVTEYMKFVRAHLSERWLQEWVVEGTGHYPHADDVEEVGPVIEGFLRD
ncbi:alpha/beta hydrolase [Aspergillus ibericus CBS 121593]|uniref:Alpha/beta-hydrolase n=1 Tax=Aspergillus ibericus CBS 121593 TaxID=1448316 RepID=A0A395H994_9EURO|nr:alpha/beta-hydrolase [Aspergillus ibericus CBS 121593]RAL04422.1 alpha/beta-hydrolase [Aspergillus ibericus CBS 121593]